MGRADTTLGGSRSRFPSTSLSFILAAREDRDSRYKEHLQSLCTTYWKPVYYFIRRAWSKADSDAKDLTQGFFIALLEYDVLGRFDPSRGNFRAYLKQCLRNYLSASMRDANRLKRGGGREIVSLEQWKELAGETPVATQRTPEEEFDRDWIRELLTRCIEDLEELLREQDKEIYFETFRLYDLNRKAGEAPSYREVAGKIGRTESDVRNYLRIARRELRNLVIEKITEYVSDEKEILAEEARILGNVKTP